MTALINSQLIANEDSTTKNKLQQLQEHWDKLNAKTKIQCILKNGMTLMLIQMLNLRFNARQFTIRIIYLTK